MNTLKQTKTMDIDHEELRNWKPFLEGFFIGLLLSMMAATSCLIAVSTPTTTEDIKELRWFAGLNAAGMYILLWNLLMRKLAKNRVMRWRRQLDN